MRAGLSAGILLALPLSALPLPALADTLVDNVEGMSFDADGRVQRFTGLLVGDDGRVVQVLARGDKRPAKVDYRLDGRGRVLLPGIVDSHVRLMPLALSLVAPKPAADGTPPGEPRPEDRDLALAAAQTLLLSRGITTVVDMGTTIEDWQSYRRAGDAGGLVMRIVGYADGVDAMRLIGGPGPTPWLYDDRLRLNGVRLVLDGAVTARAAALKAPYADAPRASGDLRLGPIQLRNLMSRAAIDRFQVAVEANGDRALAALADAVDELAQTYKGERRWRLEGAELADPADLARLKPHGFAATLRPAALDPASAEARLGPARLGGVQAWKSVSGAARIAFGSGAPTLPPAPFAAIATAIARQDAQGLPFGGWQPQERLTREEALAAFTAGGAWAAQAEGRVGRLVTGARADFILVDRDPLLASPAELRETRVLQTWIGGRLAWQAGEAAGAEGR